MNDDAGSDRIWVTTVPPLEPVHLSVLIGVDNGGDAGERLVAALLDRGHQGDDGALYLLPDDLEAAYRQDGDALTVRLTAPAGVLDELVEDHDDAGLRAARAAVGGRDGRVALISRTVTSTFLAGVDPDERPPVLLIDAPGPAGRDALLAAAGRGDATIAVVPTDD
ncbi:hypothetical protein [Catenuloplanes atrovinosus]|uniref:Uncharacterized protein n=1 Tax=Catenuloplanes atrovinosus TaxID=137266 RepID=A0AAE4CBQ9_9ACTN|nr:hypothetical protein [Catenuloplanes atrovinosus]MDR7275835.1 hypothetical protein [Catenuloplanes atrovinosus]